MDHLISAVSLARVVSGDVLSIGSKESFMPQSERAEGPVVAERSPSRRKCTLLLLIGHSYCEIGLHFFFY